MFLNVTLVMSIIFILTFIVTLDKVIIYHHLSNVNTNKFIGHFIKDMGIGSGWNPFCTALILQGIHSERLWKHSSNILVHTDIFSLFWTIVYKS